MKESNIRNKSFAFAVRIVRLYQYLCSEKKEFIMSKQLLKSGTNPGAMVREAEQGESKADFIHKYSIALKETNETCYWLELLHATDYLTKEEYESINIDAVELIKIFTTIIKNTKQNIKINKQ